MYGQQNLGYGNVAGQLPFSPSQIEVSATYNGYPPPVPVEPFLQQFVQQCANFLVQELQQKAQANNLRVFLWNQIAQNNFNNPDFVTLLKNTLDYFKFCLNRQMYRTHHEGLQIAATQMCEMVCAANTRRFTALQNWCDMNVINPILIQFDQVTQDMDRSSYNQQPAPAYPAGVQQVVGTTGGGYYQDQGNRTGVFNTFQGGQQQQPQGRSGLFSPAPQPVSQSQTSSMGDRMGKDFGSSFALPQDTQAVPQPQASAEKPQPSAKPLNMATINKQWKPTREKPYRPAYQPSQYEMFATVVGKDQYEYNVRELSEMDQARHRITPLFGTFSSLVSDNLDQKATTQTLSQAIKSAELTNPGDDVTMNSYARVVKENCPIEVGFESVWVEGQIELVKRHNALAAKDSSYERIRILQWCQTIVKPMVMNHGAREHVEELSRCVTFRECIKKMDELRGVLPPDLFGTIDRRLVMAVNRALRQNLSLAPELNIEVFYTDVPALFEWIEKNLGDEILSCLTKHQGDIIESALTVLSEEVANSVTEAIYEITAAENIPIFYFSEVVSFTFLNCQSFALDIDFASNTSAMLTKQFTPIFFKLAELIYREFGKQADRHLIRTLDGRVLEISKGWIGQECYLITLVK